MNMAQPEISSQKKIIKTGKLSESEWSKLGNHLLTKFHVLMRVSQIYDSKNVALHQFTQECLEAINTFIQDQGFLYLKIVGDDFFINDQRLRYSIEGFNSYKYLLAQWKKRSIGGVHFKGVIDDFTLREFIYILMALEEGKEENADLFNECLRKRKISSIEIHVLEGVEQEEGLSLQKEDSWEVGKKVFFESIGTIKEIFTQMKGKSSADVRKLKRLVRKAVHLMMEDESILLGMATIKNYDQYTFNHSVNVAIYALAMGKRLCLTRKELNELGITALFHDIGKSKIPLEVLNKPSSLDEEEWGIMKRHPLMGVEIVLNLKQLGEINPRMVVGIFDHHLKNDLSGYPKLFRKKEVSLFGKIIQIADAYDAMTTPRIYKKHPFTPEQALALLLKEREVHYDPILLKIFIGVIGLYPIGSLVLLNTKEIGIVYKSNPDPQNLDRPQIFLIEKIGEKKERVRLVNLMERDGVGGYRRSILKTLDPMKYHIDVAKYFLLEKKS
ncbi:MAG: HD-GYP domain-containing protein [Thermodesulfobacteriota bacterium]